MSKQDGPSRTVAVRLGEAATMALDSLKWLVSVHPNIPLPGLSDADIVRMALIYTEHDLREVLGHATNGTGDSSKTCDPPLAPPPGA